MNTSQIIVYIILPLAGYLLGSIPFGFLIGLAKGVDIHKAGSGNIGATNLGRVCGRKFFFYAMLLDAAKGFAPTFVAALLAARSGLPDWAGVLTAVAAVLGHLFPIYLRFKGGKGVSTSLGVVLGIWPLYTMAGFGALATFIIVFFAFRYISVASILSSTGFAFYVLYLGLVGTPFENVVHSPRPWPNLLPLVIMAFVFAGLIAVRHRGNIKRLLNGTEPRFGQKKESQLTRYGA